MPASRPDFEELAHTSCADAHGPPCLPLLEDPAGVLMSHADRPRHVCWRLLARSTERWAMRALTLPVASKETPWPLPVGRRSAPRYTWGHLRVGTDSPALRDIVLQMPFESNDTAALALRVEIDGGQIDLFGLVLHDFNEVEGELFVPRDLVCVVRGTHVALATATILAETAQAWWGEVSGSIVRRRVGRPRGVGLLAHWSLAQLREAFAELQAEHRRQGRPAPIQLDFAEVCLGRVSTDTLVRRLRQLGHTWDSFRILS